MTPGTTEISTPPEIAAGTHFRAQHGIKTILVFLPTDGEAYWLVLLCLLFFLSGNTMEIKLKGSQQK